MTRTVPGPPAPPENDASAAGRLLAAGIALVLLFVAFGRGRPLAREEAGEHRDHDRAVPHAIDQARACGHVLREALLTVGIVGLHALGQPRRRTANRSCTAETRRQRTSPRRPAASSF